MPRARRVRAADVKLPKTWGKTGKMRATPLTSFAPMSPDAVRQLWNVPGDVVPAAELRRRLRDVAEAAGGRWDADARWAERAFAERVAGGESDVYIESALDYAILNRGLLSLCEVE